MTEAAAFHAVLTGRLKKLGLAGESGLMLSSVYGQGYRLDTVQGS